MPPKMNIWSNEAEQLLIDLIETRRILWDITDNNYRRNDWKEIQWEEISQKMGTPYTIEHVKKRWNNMRGTFLDNDRKVRESKRSGSGAEEIFKPRWPLYTRLLFLRKTISSAPSVSNLSPYVPNLSHNQSQPYNEKDQQDFSDVQSLQVPAPEICEENEMHVYFDATSKTLTLIPQDNEVSIESSPNSPESLQEDNLSRSTSSMSTIFPSTSHSLSISGNSTPVSAESVRKYTETEDSETLYTKRRVSKKHKSGSSVEEAIEVMKQIASQPIVLSHSVDAKDTIDHFTAYIGAKLRDMSPQRRKLLEAEIMKLLFAN